MDTAGSEPSLNTSSWCGTIRRVLATALAFVIFGIGGPFLALMMVIRSALTTKPEAKRARTRQTISFTFWAYIQLLKWLGLLSYSISNREEIKAGQLILANHPTLLDVVFIIGMAKGANCVVKSALWKNPFTWAPVSAAGYIANGDPELLNKCRDSIARGETLVVFPEGTRSTPGQPLKFLRGAANIALASCNKVLPIIITCKPATLLKGQKWYKVPKSTPHFHLEIKDELDITKYCQATPYQGKNARSLCRDLEQYFDNAIKNTIN